MNPATGIPRLFVWSVVVVTTASLPCRAVSGDPGLSAVTSELGVSGVRVETSDLNHVTLFWNHGTPVDVYLSASPQAKIEQASLIAHANAEGALATLVDPLWRPYFIIRSGAPNSFIRTAQRVLPLEQGSNFRDLGGYPAASGKHVRWGLLYRSAAAPLLSDNDVRYLRRLGIRTVVDLRSSEERRLARTRFNELKARQIEFGYEFATLLPASPDTDSGYREWLTVLAPEYRAVFRQLLDHHVPLIFHCTAGQDRTGELSALILSALGVPRERIFEDYRLSTLYRRPRYEVPAIDAEKYHDNPAAKMLANVPASTPMPLEYPSRKSFLQDLFDEVDAHWGSMDNYLREVLGIDDGERRALQRDYLE